jgi:hypothetical protein
MVTTLLARGDLKPLFPDIKVKYLKNISVFNIIAYP